MTSVLEKSVFVHIPKTGGTWITEILQQNMLGRSHLHPRLKHCNRQEICYNIDDDLNEKVFFAFVRNPVTWYQSRWSCNFNRKYFTKNGKRRPGRPFFQDGLPRPQVWSKTRLNAIWTQQEFDNFNVWAKRVINNYPKWVEDLYQFYLGKNYDVCEYIGHYENLVPNLINILKTIGEDVNPTLIKSGSTANESDKNLDRRWDKFLLKQVIKNNYTFMERFGYSTKIKDYRYLCL